MTQHSRRQFLGVLGASAVAGTGISGPVSAQQTPVVAMGNNYFDPIGLHVEPGTTIRFEIEAGAHSATAYPDRIPSDTSVFDSETITQGSYEHTFETPGTYDYYCIPHKTVGMVGRIVVGSPGGPAEDTPIPNGEVPSSEDIVQQGAIAFGTDDTGSGTTGGGMMGPDGMMGHGGYGMTSGRTGRWLGSVPFVGSALGMLGIIGGALYLAFGRGNGTTNRNDPAIATLEERYERGEFDEEEFRRRREVLESSDEPSRR
ncbi:MAG: plastocyanin/azurin family copper-binding protein [Natronomonas sp.]